MKKNSDVEKETEKYNVYEYAGRRSLGFFILAQFFIISFLIAAISYTFYSFYKIAKNNVSSMGETALLQVAEKLDGFLVRHEEILALTARNVNYMLENGDSYKRVRNYFFSETQKYAESPDYDIISVYGLVKGKYISGRNWTPKKTFDPTKRSWFKAALAAQGKVALVSPYIDAVSGKVVFSVSQMLPDKKGVVAIDIKMDELQKFAYTIHAQKNAEGFIMSAEGLVVAHSDPSENGKNYLLDKMSAQTLWHRDIAKLIIAKNHSAFNLKYDFGKIAVFSHTVNSRWKICMITGENELFAGFKKNLYLNIFLAFCIFSLILYLCALAYSDKYKSVNISETLRRYKIALEAKIKKQDADLKIQAQNQLIMQETVIEGMASLIEYRDVNTGKHVQNTKFYSKLLAHRLWELGLYKGEIDKNYIWMMGNAAALHDVGKISITDRILNKPEKLNDYEYEVMKTHTLMGGGIIRNIFGRGINPKIMKMSSEVAQYHHERWDGKGYPFGLKGEEIPLCARIVSIADVFDALVSPRVYKHAMSYEESFAILKKDAGTHFDPELVKIFLDLKPKIIEYLMKNQKNFKGL